MRRTSLLAALFALTLAACTTSEEPPSTLTPTDTASPTKTPTAAATQTSDADDGQLSATATTAGVPVRVAPGDQYAIVGFLPAGGSATAIAAQTRAEPRWVLLEGLGWVALDETALTLSGDVDSLPTSAYPLTMTLYDEAPPTGIATVDQVVAAVLEGDDAALAAALEFQDQACTLAREASDSPPACPDGIAEGEPVTVFPVTAGEFGWSTDTRADLIANWLVPGEPLRLYAVATAADRTRFDADYRVYVSTNDGEGRSLTMTQDGAITLLSWAEPRAAPYMLVVSGEPPPEFVLPPPVPAGLEPSN